MIMVVNLPTIKVEIVEVMPMEEASGCQVAKP
jgi:hypothetical protein